MDDKALGALLKEIRTIAVVGLTPNPERPAHRVAAYLSRQGYRVVPVHPATGEVLGQKGFPTLRDIPFPVDLVDVFRRSDAVPPIAGEAAAIGARCLWLQVGIAHPEAEAAARQAGLAVISDRCLMMEHLRLAGGIP